MACKNYCSGNCTCTTPDCKRVAQNYTNLPNKAVNTNLDLKDLLNCNETILKNGQIILVATTGKYVMYDANTNSFFETNIAKGNAVVLP